MSPDLAARAWIHGTSRDTPVESSFGVIFSHASDAQECSGFLGRASKQSAEQSALITALTLATRNGCDTLEVLSDSDTLIQRLLDGYRVSEPELIEGSLRVLSLRRKFRKVSGTLISQEENQGAVDLSSRALAQRLAPPAWA